MNLDALYELRERLNSSVIAGVGLIGEDFRLRRAIEGIEPLAKASPVFQKISAMARPLTEEKNADAPERLLDVLALVDAVLCTQGTVSVSQEIFPIELPKMDGAYQPQTYRMLAPLLTALTSTGGGRYNVICDAMRNTPYLFRDYRISVALVNALGDSYAEIADEVEKFFSTDGRDLAPLLKQGFDPLGKKDMVRRVHVLSKVSGAKENDWYLSMLEQKCSPSVRCALLEALRFDCGNAQRLLEAVVQEKGNAKKSALTALAFLDTEEANQFFLERLNKNPDSVEEALVYSKSDCISDYVAAHLTGLLDRLLEQNEMSMEEMQEWNLWIRLAQNKTSENMCRFYEKANDSAPILENAVGIKDGKKVPVEIVLHTQYHTASPLCVGLGAVMMQTAVEINREEFLRSALAMWQKHRSAISAGAAVISGLLRFSGEEAYETLGKPAKATEKLSRTDWTREGWPVFWMAMERLRRQDNEIDLYRGMDFHGIPQYRNTMDDLDPRWFDLLLNPQIARTEEGSSGLGSYERLAYQLVRVDQRDICHALAERIRSQAKKQPQHTYFDLLIRLKETNFRGLIAPYAAAYRYYSKANLLNLLKSSSMTPQEMIDELHDLAKVCRKSKHSYYLTADDVETMVQQLQSGLTLDQIME